MAYNRENLLRRIIEVQKITIDEKKRGLPQTEIYRRFIKGVYHISYSTFNTWIGVPAHADLEKLRKRKERAAAIKRQQKTIWED